ncbi:MAG: AAA family ATPase [Anaerolineae bacterium]|jgi:predicted ATPase|nr:AAA family ATPase [Anaerolineae bacterium]
MLKQLRFKNWRSLRDVTIDLSPLTVFIGANSSGKTNIIDGIKFMRDVKLRGLMPLVAEFGYQAIQSREPLDNGIVEFEFLFDSFFDDGGDVSDLLRLKFDEANFPFEYASGLEEGGLQFEAVGAFEELPSRFNPEGELRKQSIATDVNDDTDSFRRRISRWVDVNDELISRYQHRMQFINELFLPTRRLAGREGGSLYLIEPDGRNTLLILEYLKEAYPDVFKKLNEDVQWLLGHVSQVETYRNLNTRDIELLINEGIQKRAPTVSVGTLRAIGILAGLHGLDIPRPRPPRMAYQRSSDFTPEFDVQTPGLVVIEEPDTALNPGVLRKFVELLRGYVENPDGTRPRQIIMTTHNPTFLNYFQPDEVRVVERGEDGYTTVNRVPEFIKENWLDEHTLGDMWLTNLFGGTNF